MTKKERNAANSLARYYRRPWAMWTEEEKEHVRRLTRKRRKLKWAAMTTKQRHAVWLKQKAAMKKKAKAADQPTHEIVSRR
jgi:predicted Fe-S protein YdhL (DUF1289 family)